jgi:hypothetical protein
MIITNLAECVNILKTTSDSEKLKNELGNTDNWPILFFGDGNKIVDEITTDMEKSKESHDLFSGAYILMPDHITYDSNRPVRKFYSYEPGTVTVQVHRITDTLYTQSNEHQVNGKHHSLFVSLHPYQEKKIEGLDDFQAIAQVVADFGEYILKKGVYTIKMPKTRLQAHHIIDN